MWIDAGSVTWMRWVKPGSVVHLLVQSERSSIVPAEPATSAACLCPSSSRSEASSIALSSGAAPRPPSAITAACREAVSLGCQARAPVVCSHAPAAGAMASTSMSLLLSGERSIQPAMCRSNQGNQTPALVCAPSIAARKHEGDVNTLSFLLPPHTHAEPSTPTRKRQSPGADQYWAYPEKTGDSASTRIVSLLRLLMVRWHCSMTGW